MEQQHNSHALTDGGKLPRWKFAVYAFLSAGAIVLSLSVSQYELRCGRLRGFLM